MKPTPTHLLLATLCVLLSCSITACAGVPVIYCTDLFHPHDDPDDHFDLATLFALPDLDLRAIVLDQGDKQQQRPGTIPVSQLLQITGRQVPVAIGLSCKLQDPKDKGLEEPAEFQRGVELILQTLRDSPNLVNIITVGSVRDVVAAYNREPALCRSKIERLLCFIGEASEPAFREYNVELDVHAYVGLMRSDLPVWWVPCFDGGLWQNRGHASFWQAAHRDLLQGAKPRIIQYFIYALQQPQADPQAFLEAPVDAWQQEHLLTGVRNLWCTTIFQVVTWPPGKTGDGIFGFAPVTVTVDDRGVMHYDSRSDARKVMRFEVRSPAEYAPVMTQSTARLLERLQ